MELDFYGKGQVNNNLHGSFHSSMTNFLETDIAGTPTYSMNTNIISQLQQSLLKFSDSVFGQTTKIFHVGSTSGKFNDKKICLGKTIKNCNFSH
jgi:hypothetical protein